MDRRIHIRLPQLFVVSVGLLILITLSGCATLEQDVTIYQNEGWKGRIHMGLAPQTIAFSGGELELASNLDEWKQKAEALDAKGNWKRSVDSDGISYYTLEATGQGYDALNQILFLGDAEIKPIMYKGEKAVQFQYLADSGWGLASYEMHLHSGEILDSNGVRRGKSDVNWNVKGQNMKAIVRPEDSSSFPIMLVLVVILALGAGVIYLISR